MNKTRTGQYMRPEPRLRPFEMMIFSHQDHKIPEFKEKKGKEWIMFGHDNLYPDYLLQIYQRSAIHNAIVNGKVDYILGDGWRGDADFIANANRKESLDELTEKTILDFEIFNGFAFEIIWNMEKTSFEMFHFPFNKVRTDENEKEFFTSDDWTKGRQDDDTGFRKWEPFTGKPPEEGKQLAYFALKSPPISGQSSVYPKPDYIGANPAIETDIEIANFDLNNLKSGFWAGTIVNFNNGMPTDEKKKEIEKKLKEKFTGTDKAGSIITMFNDGKDRSTTIERISPSDIGNHIDSVQNRIEQQIFTGHKVTSPMLFGVKTEGQLGGRTEFAESFEIFENTYVNSRRRIIEKVINRIGSKGGRGTVQIGEIQTPEAPATMNAVASTVPTDEQSDRIMEFFKESGEEKAGFKVLGARVATFDSQDDSFLQKFQQELSELQINIVDLLTKDPLMPPNRMARVLGKRISDIEKALAFLEKEGLIIVSQVQSGDKDEPEITKRVPTKDAEESIEGEDIETREIEVRYSYEVDGRFGAPVIPATRPFCRDLLSLDRLYTRKEIEDISKKEGRNVWEFRGGWYRNPRTGINVPFCRHIWKQNIVEKR